ncbi:helix-turn-helix domain-containing protein [Teredinibacter turnerae]|uniref:helix-turn-helix domain-containing protein n=1 Tax=Teredinibacter turnerae TaxID=2426 RepID=UPI00036FFC88|nr:helix-turn-helix domain-containing protein [Teredinibacter turnerae]
MKSLLFNIHDLILILSISAFCLIAIRQLVHNSDNKPARRLWLGFWTLNVLASGYTLLFWSDALRRPAFDAAPYLFCVLGTTSLLTGPALLFSLIQSSSNAGRFLWRHFAHLLPFAISIVYLYVVCFRFDSDTQRFLFLELHLYQQVNTYYFTFVSLTKLLPVIYALAAVIWLSNNTNTLCEKAGCSAAKQQRYIRLCAGFLFLWSWGAVTHFIGRHFPSDFPDLMGIVGNYLTFFLALIFLLDRDLSSGANATKATNIKNPDPSKSTQKAAIEKAVLIDRIYLNPQLNLERFAEYTNLSTRDISAVINQEFEKNFHEFINTYRVEAAKIKLRDDAHKHQSISEIGAASGFNSTATFNRLFKKLVQVTPSDYRKSNEKTDRGCTFSISSAK